MVLDVLRQRDATFPQVILVSKRSCCLCSIMFTVSRRNEFIATVRGERYRIAAVRFEKQPRVMLCARSSYSLENLA